MKGIKLESIGYVVTKAVGREVRDRSNISKIVLIPDLVEALEGLEDFSHIFVIFWMHEIVGENRRMTKVHPRGRREIPRIGIFGTRTPFRRNPIGLTLVELLEVKENILVVRGLDAFNNTPVLDIKPFDPWDVVEDAKVPEWWMRLERERSRKTS
ncbi:MAG: tRNA (N6-threonylcarbamoyladenosine(37)-N6)-methyltransferase TrmO [Candidatus Bathyarchaeota archaeon]|nr:MAG: tRNA (N6-threonylcarbamoyladenosine(37)-N6)-methyltransferase TrmO [Candidatus Bathyarchaeota archaeon]